MQILNQTYQALSQKPQIIFITLDPEKDSTLRLNNFVHQFNPSFIGLRGKIENIRALQKALHVKRTTRMDIHATDIILINPKGQVQAYFQYPITASELIRDLKKITH